jgi:electron transport complex protein RnfB
MPETLVEQIDALLPQTQCGKCGFPGCQPYAQAISLNQADINQCPPGGSQGISKLAKLLGREAKPLNPQFGVEQPRMVAVINETDCIGCTKCIPVCPVDAIIGAAKLMHTVIAQQCTGCELCIAPCPVDCITLELANFPSWSQEDADQAKQRYQARNLRIKQQETAKAERINRQKQLIAQLNAQKTRT